MISGWTSTRSGSGWLPDERATKSAYIVEYVDHIEDEHGNVTEVHVVTSEQPQWPRHFRCKTKGTLHWVAAIKLKKRRCGCMIDCSREASPEADGDFMDALNPNSLKILKGCKVEPSLSTAEVRTIFQFTRLSYFNVDSKYSTRITRIDRAVTLKDGWKGGGLLFW